jgi:hypothetical protein
MKPTMKITLSKRVLIVALAVALLLSAINTYLIFDNARVLQEQLGRLQRDYSADDSTFDYVIFQEDGLYKAKNQTSGSVDFASTTASSVISQAVTKGTAVYIKLGIYPLSTDAQAINKKNARIVSDGATIIGNGNKILIKGDNYTYSQYNSISGLKIINGTLRIENSFAVTVTNMVFENCSTALELVNTDTWTEGTKIENCHFINAAEAIAFRTPVGNGTGSYASTEITRSFFNLKDDSVGINVEPRAEYSDSQLQNSRLWLGENGQRNQTGLKLDGSMHQTLLASVVFESFATAPENLYAIAIGETAITTPILDGGVTFLGNWTARIYNPFDRWISGLGSLFRRINVDIPIGLSNEYAQTTNIHARPLTISSFKPRIQVEGNFGNSETVTVRFRLELVDNVISESVEKTFTNTTTAWLTDDEMLKLFPSQDVVWAILVDAKSTSASTGVVVRIDVYGTTT